MALTVSDLTSNSTPGRQWDLLVEHTQGIDPWCSRLPWQRSVDSSFGHRFDDDDLDNDQDDDQDDDQDNDQDDDQDNDLERGISQVDGESRHPAGPEVSGNEPGGQPTSPEPEDDDLVEITDRWAFAFRRRRLADGTPVLMPLDSVWAFASPVVVDRGATTVVARRSAATELVDALLTSPKWNIAFLTGMERECDLFSSIAYELSSSARLVEGESTVRCVASLEGGVDAFLARRPRTFRRNLRAAERVASNGSITFESADRAEPTSIISRLHHVEQRSWKGIEGSGITAPDMATLYSLLVRELHAVGGLRVTFAKRDDTDIGFILGGVLASNYRGLQISFAEEVRRFSVGNLLQLHEICRLCDEGVVHYDLGMDMPYKRLWSDGLMTTTPIVVVRR